MCSTPWSHHHKYGIHNLYLHMEYEEVYVGQNEPYIFFSYCLAILKNSYVHTQYKTFLFTIYIALPIISPQARKLVMSGKALKRLGSHWPCPLAPLAHHTNPSNLVNCEYLQVSPVLPDGANQSRK